MDSTPLCQYTDQIDIHGIADLSAVPRFARGIAQSIVSGLVKYPVMLDWDGNISQAYKVETLSEINLKIAELLD